MDGLFDMVFVLVVLPLWVAWLVGKYTALAIWTVCRVVAALVMALSAIQRLRIERRTDRATSAIEALRDAAQKDMDRLARTAGRR